MMTLKVNEILIDNFGYTLEYLKSGRISRKHSYVRMSLYKILYENFLMTHVGIGSMFSRHHTTIMYGVAAHYSLMEYTDYAEIYNKLYNKLLIIEANESEHSDRHEFAF